MEKVTVRAGAVQGGATLVQGPGSNHPPPPTALSQQEGGQGPLDPKSMAADYSAEED
jgi:hypothetical protein